jgi:hypothetical protein
MPDPIQLAGAAIDLSDRVFRDATVDASPAAAAETVVGTISIPSDLAVTEGVLVMAWLTLTVGTDGVSVLTRIRRDSVTGTAIAASGATTATATNLIDRTIIGFDTSPTLPNEVYVVTLTVGSASAASTVSAIQVVALVI